MESMGIYRSSSPKLQRVVFKNDGEEQKSRGNSASQFACQYRIAPSKVKETAQKVIYSYHPHLREANIAFLFRSGNWKNKGRVVTGKAAPVPELWRFLSGCDLALIINETIWHALPDKGRIFLLDHELSHFTEPTLDKHGNKKWSTRSMTWRNSAKLSKDTASASVTPAP